MPRDDAREPVLVAEAGVAYDAIPADPIAAWFDLMEAIDALAPVTPASAPLVLTDARI